MDSEMSLSGRAEFGVSVNPTPTGVDYAHHITARPPGFENLTTSLMVWLSKCSGFFRLVDLAFYIFVSFQVAHRTLDDEEAEERFAQRDKILSRWTQNLNKKLNPDQGADDDELDDEDNKKGKKKGKFTRFFVC